jgi:hypothetical protein
VGLERGPLSLVSTTDELLDIKSSSSGLENLDYCRRGSDSLTKRHSVSEKKVYSSSNRNEHQKQKNNVSGE